jgi:hypothetical protein
MISVRIFESCERFGLVPKHLKSANMKPFEENRTRFILFRAVGSSFRSFQQSSYCLCFNRVLMMYVSNFEPLEDLDWYRSILNQLI